MSGTAAPPGWHPDPWQPGHQRWWDGTAWTGYTAAPAPAPGQVLRLDEEERLAARARVAVLAVVPVLLVSQVGFFLLVRFFVDGLNGDSFGTSNGFATDFGPAYWARQLLVQVGGIGNIVAGVLFLVWFHRAGQNARALGLPARRDPSLATASFVIPIVNLWWPYQSTCDLLPPDHPGRPWVLRWWLLWVVGASVSLIAVVIGAVLSDTVGWVVLVVPAVQILAAALAARHVIADVGEAHRSLSAGAGAHS